MIPFERKLGARIHEELTRQREILENHMAISTFHEYHYVAGYIAALKIVVDEYFEDVNSELERDE